jgi:ElaB/YqjD/DUF883 family membrane-anchored ribosome-binding protein
MTASSKEEGLEAAKQKAKSLGEDELAQQLDALRDDLADLGKTVRALAQEGSKTAQRGAREITDTVARRSQELVDEAKTAGQQAVDYGSEVLREKYNEFETTVRRHPTTAVAVALAVGYLVGLLSRNR